MALSPPACAGPRRPWGAATVCLAALLALRAPLAVGLACAGFPGKAVAMAPALRLPCQDLALERIGKGDAQGAFRALGQARRFHPGHGEVWGLLGALKMDMGDPAAADLERASALRPWIPAIRINLALARFN